MGINVETSWLVYYFDLVLKITMLCHYIFLLDLFISLLAQEKSLYKLVVITRMIFVQSSLKNNFLFTSSCTRQTSQFCRCNLISIWHLSLLTSLHVWINAGIFQHERILKELFTTNFIGIIRNDLCQKFKMSWQQWLGGYLAQITEKDRQKFRKFKLEIFNGSVVVLRDISCFPLQFPVLCEWPHVWSRHKL